MELVQCFLLGIYLINKKHNTTAKCCTASHGRQCRDSLETMILALYLYLWFMQKITSFNKMKIADNFFGISFSSTIVAKIVRPTLVTAKQCTIFTGSGFYIYLALF